jgi:hypothetical protein
MLSLFIRSGWGQFGLAQYRISRRMRRTRRMQRELFTSCSLVLTAQLSPLKSSGLYEALSWLCPAGEVVRVTIRQWKKMAAELVATVPVTGLQQGGRFNQDPQPQFQPSYKTARLDSPTIHFQRYSRMISAPVQVTKNYYNSGH